MTEAQLNEWARKHEQAKSNMRHVLKGELPLDNTGLESNKGVRQEEVGRAPGPPKPKFDKVAYQREYMRKRRKHEKEKARETS